MTEMTTKWARAWRVGRALVGAALCGCAVVGVCLPTAQAGDQITLELNKLEDREGACRAYLVFGNGSKERFDAFVLDLIVFDREEVIAKHLAVDAAPLRVDKTIVKMFDIAGIGCEQIGRILLNDITKCESVGDARADCIDAVVPSSRAAGELVK